MIVEPGNETLSYDREFVVSLDDWLDGVDGTPEDTFETLKSGGSAMASMDGMSGMEGMDHGMEGMPDMSGMGEESGNTPPAEWPPDVTYPMYLVNGKAAEEPEEFAVGQGDRVRLRLINPSASTIYRVALEGHKMTVTHADGQPVEPVEVDALRIGMGERYDVLVDAGNPGVWQLAAQAEGTEEIARATFRYEGSADEPPPPDRKPGELGSRMLLYNMLEVASEANVPPEGEPDEVGFLGLVDADAPRSAHRDLGDECSRQPQDVEDDVRRVAAPPVEGVDRLDRSCQVQYGAARNSPKAATNRTCPTHSTSRDGHRC